MKRDGQRERRSLRRVKRGVPVLIAVAFLLGVLSGLGLTFLSPAFSALTAEWEPGDFRMIWGTSLLRGLLLSIGILILRRGLTALLLLPGALFAHGVWSSVVTAFLFASRSPVLSLVGFGMAELVVTPAVFILCAMALSESVQMYKTKPGGERYVR